MKIATFPEDWVTRKQEPKWFDSFARKSLFRILNSLKSGYLLVNEGEETYEFGDPASELRAHVIITRPAFYRMVLLHGSIGAGEAYMSGCWHSPDLTNVVRLICRNMQQLQDMESGLSSVLLKLDRIRSFFLPNSVAGSRKNIHAHYDLSNDLFKVFLDQRMMYSSGIFENGKSTLEESQQFKLQTIARKLDLRDTDKVIEIGTGWGGLAIFLAENYGCHVTTTTISREQFEYASEQVQNKNLGHLVTVLEQDYRDLSGQFDKLVSVEMIEAVGHKYLPCFFEKCDSLVKPGGKMVLQAITMPEQRYEYAKNNIDFIQRYIFPGGFLPSVEGVLNNAGKHTRMQIEHLQDIGLDYAETLAHWRQRFTSARDTVSDLGFDNIFTRLWEYYFCYCEGGFRERAISTVQVTFRRV